MNLTQNILKIIVNVVYDKILQQLVTADKFTFKFHFSVIKKFTWQHEIEARFTVIDNVDIRGLFYLF